jgi:NAD(P)-dependent dehydrogenase (short-subunit alcohol dehydrogenase family)
MPSVLITGANRGLGLEFARQYAAEGWQVIATCRRPEEADALKALGANVTLHGLDVADLGAIASLSRTLEGAAIDVLIANAGIGFPDDMSPTAIDEERWMRAFRINTMAPLALAVAFRPQVARSRLRKVVGISSYLGSIGGNAGGGAYIYRSSKAALNAVWRSFALDNPDLVAVVLSPGWVRTDMGGPAAPLSPGESVKAMRRVIAGLSPADSGSFIDREGKPVPW